MKFQSVLFMSRKYRPEHPEVSKVNHSPHIARQKTEVIPPTIIRNNRIFRNTIILLLCGTAGYTAYRLTPYNKPATAVLVDNNLPSLTTMGSPTLPDKEQSYSTEPLLIDFGVDASISLPAIEWQDTAMALPLPYECKQLSREQLIHICQKTVRDLQARVQTELNSMVRVVDPKVYDKITNETTNFLRTQHPEIDAVFQQFFARQPMRVTGEDMVAELNKYLVLGGSSLEILHTDNALPRLQLFPITHVSQVLINWEGFPNTSIPIIHLTHPFPSEDPSIKLDHVGNYNKNLRIIKLFPERLLKGNDRIDQPSVVPALVQQMLQDTAMHEGMHGFIHTLLQIQPNVTPQLAPVQIHIGHQPLHIASYHTQSMAEELSAIGFELVSSPEVQTKLIKGLLQLKISPQHDYFLVSRILPLALLDVAPHSTQKKQVFQRLSASGSLSDTDIQVLLQDPSFSLIQQKKVGTILYGMGMKLLRPKNR